jgi:hypothetical protein
MKYLLIIFALILGSFVITSCKKPEPTRVEKAQAHVPAKGLVSAMKKASIKMRRLAKAVKNDDWDEMDIWTHELKEGIGFNCVELYMIENNDIPNEFTVLCNKFNTAINKLMLSGKKHDTNNASLEFNNLVNSCESCHEEFNKNTETELDFSG